MLGAIKIKGNSGGPSLFRVLSRRWRPLMTTPRPKRVMLRNALALEDDDVKPERRAWIGAKRAHHEEPPAVVSSKRERSNWNPWLWVR